MKKENYRSYIYVWLLCFLYVLPIILANRYYLDDTQRVIYHGAGWSLDGRPLTDLVTRLMCGMRSGIYDIFPLPLLLAITVFAIVSVEFSSKIYKANGAVLVLASLLPITLPFFLSNLSYRFDCLGMVLSVVLLMVPFFIDIDNGWKKVAVDGAFVLLSMCFYQASVGMFLGLSLIVALMKIIKQEKFSGLLLCETIAFVIGVGLYKLVIAKIFVDKTGWRAEAGSLATPSSMIGQVVANFKGVLQLVVAYLRGAGIRQILVFALVFAIGVFSLWRSLKEEEHPKRQIVIMLYPVTFVAAFIISVLPMMVLARTYAQSRRQVGLMIIMFILAFVIVIIAWKYPRMAAVCGTVMFLFQFSFSCAYGNALRAQKEYEEQVVYEITSDIDNMADTPVRQIAVEGTMPYSPLVKSDADMLPLLYDLVLPGVDGDGMLQGAIINHYSSVPLEFVDLTEEDHRFMDSAEPKTDKMIYSLYYNKDKVYLRFKQ